MNPISARARSLQFTSIVEGARGGHSNPPLFTDLPTKYSAERFVAALCVLVHSFVCSGPYRWIIGACLFEFPRLASRSLISHWWPG